MRGNINTLFLGKGGGTIIHWVFSVCVCMGHGETTVLVGKQ